jgi:hypothetical protein
MVLLDQKEQMDQKEKMDQKEQMVLLDQKEQMDQLDQKEMMEFKGQPDRKGLLVHHQFQFHFFLQYNHKYVAMD